MSVVLGYLFLVLVCSWHVRGNIVRSSIVWSGRRRLGSSHLCARYCCRKKKPLNWYIVLSQCLVIGIPPEKNVVVVVVSFATLGDGIRPPPLLWRWWELLLLLSVATLGGGNRLPPLLGLWWEVDAGLRHPRPKSRPPPPLAVPLPSPSPRSTRRPSRAIALWGSSRPTPSVSGICGLDAGAA